MNELIPWLYCRSFIGNGRSSGRPDGVFLPEPQCRRDANALSAAVLSLSGIRRRITFDEMLAVMYQVGRWLSTDFRETGMGGCAVAPSACAVCEH